jgi:hypothetical protein
MHDDTAEMIGTLKAFSFLGIFETAPVAVKLMLIIIAGAGLVAVIAAIARRLSNGRWSSLLATMGRIGLYAGAAGTGYMAIVTYLTAKALHETRFVIYEPEVIEAVCVLLLGVVVYVIARLGNAGAKRA